MIPVFVTLAIYYGQSIQRGTPLEWQRFAAILCFGRLFHVWRKVQYQQWQKWRQELAPQSESRRS
jgi:hypothetical protein